MIRRAFLFFLIAGAAHAAFYPVFEPSYIQLRPGQTVTVSGSAAWLSGISVVPFQPMTFTSNDPAIATVEGYLPTSQRQPVRITAHASGVTRARILESTNIWPTSAVIVVAERELPVAIDVEGALVPGSSITIRARSDEPDATFTWFYGRRGGLYTIEAGREGRRSTSCRT